MSPVQSFRHRGKRPLPHHRRFSVGSVQYHVWFPVNGAGQIALVHPDTCLPRVCVSVTDVHQKKYCAGKLSSSWSMRTNSVTWSKRSSTSPKWSENAMSITRSSPSVLRHFFFQQLAYLVETYFLFKVLRIYHGAKVLLIHEKRERKFAELKMICTFAPL